MESALATAGARSVGRRPGWRADSNQDSAEQALSASQASVLRLGRVLQFGRLDLQFGGVQQEPIPFGRMCELAGKMPSSGGGLAFGVGERLHFSGAEHRPSQVKVSMSPVAKTWRSCSQVDVDCMIGIAAAVRDGYGGQPPARIFWDVAGVLDPSLERPLFRSPNGPGEMKELWLDLGLRDVEQVSLLTHMELHWVSPRHQLP